MSKRPPDPQFMTVEDMVRVLYERVVGDGTENNPGLVTRVDRLEGKQKIISWVAGSAMGVAIVAVGNWCWSKVTGGHP